MRSALTEECKTSADPLLSHAELPFERSYFPLGFAARIATNSRLVLDAAEQSWRGTHKRFDAEAIRIEIGVSEEAAAVCAEQPVFRSRGHLLTIISDRANFVVCDMRAGFVFGWITRATAANESLFRYHFLEAAVLTVIDHLHLAPVHGALVGKNDTGVLLTGDTGAGKSTLALACAVAGWDYLSDDASYLLRNRSDLLSVGNSHVIRLRAHAATLFEHLGTQRPIVRPNGKCGFELFTADLPDIRTRDEIVIRHLVRIQRSACAVPSLVPLRSDRSAGFLQRAVRYGDEHVMREQSEAYERLASANWWTLTYSHFDDAIPLLNSLVKE
jgi:hypothetical protein